MITFNLQVEHNGNWFCGFEPSEDRLGPWAGEQCEALVLTIEQAREIALNWSGCSLRFEIAYTGTPITDERFQQELFCVRDGEWHDYRKPCEPICDGPCKNCGGLMSGKWYAVDYGDEDNLRYNGLDNMFEHIRSGSVVCVTDDLETWCDEMEIDIDIENVIKTEAE